MSTITIDTTDATTIAAGVAQLDDTTRALLADALHVDNHHRPQEPDVIITEIRDVLHKEYDALWTRWQIQGGQVPVVGVLFTATEYENGFYVNDSGQVLFQDGTTDYVQFGSLIEEWFTEDYGCVGRNFTVAVDLRTDGIDADDSWEDIHVRFQHPVPWKTMKRGWHWTRGDMQVIRTVGGPSGEATSYGVWRGNTHLEKRDSKESALARADEIIAQRLPLL
jgi:hypothetical protein